MLMVRKKSAREQILEERYAKKYANAAIERGGWLQADRDAMALGLEDLFRRQIKRGVIV